MLVLRSMQSGAVCMGRGVIPLIKHSSHTAFGRPFMGGIVSIRQIREKASCYAACFTDFPWYNS